MHRVPQGLVPEPVSDAQDHARASLAGEDRRSKLELVSWTRASPRRGRWAPGARPRRGEGAAPEVEYELDLRFPRSERAHDQAALTLARARTSGPPTRWVPGCWIRRDRRARGEASQVSIAPPAMPSRWAFQRLDRVHVDSGVILVCRPPPRMWVSVRPWDRTHSVEHEGPRVPWAASPQVLAVEDHVSDRGAVDVAPVPPRRTSISNQPWSWSVLAHQRGMSWDREGFQTCSAGASNVRSTPSRRRRVDRGLSVIPRSIRVAFIVISLAPWRPVVAQVGVQPFEAYLPVRCMVHPAAISRSARPQSTRSPLRLSPAPMRPPLRPEVFGDRG